MIRWWILSLIIILFPYSGLNAQEVCFKCHSQKPFLKGRPHRPVAAGKCDQCHLPHVSRYKGLLKEPAPGLCFSCHAELKKTLATSEIVHPPVAKGSCLRCHEAHASAQKGLLNKEAKTVCLNCHKDLRQKFKISHQPFAQGKCLSCHEAHASSDRRLLKKTGADLCLSCHKESSRLSQSHQGRSFKKMDCLSCHNPHGSDRKNLIREKGHPPYEENDCQVCHQQGPKGAELCFSCHKDRKKSFEYTHNHLLGGIKDNPCLVCHSPHVSDAKALLRDTPGRLCQECHPETSKQKEKSLYVHPQWGKCLDCHVGHGSNHPAMLNGDGNAACIQCHETQGEFTHPVGEKVIDPRNGQPVTCVTCHDPMGTNFKYNLRLSGEATLCLECHKNY
ncbi:cytochrome c3 family protein [Thermosulfuriphilus sp.]